MYLGWLCVRWTWCGWVVWSAWTTLAECVVKQHWIDGGDGHVAGHTYIPRHTWIHTTLITHPRTPRHTWIQTTPLSLTREFHVIYRDSVDLHNFSLSPFACFSSGNYRDIPGILSSILTIHHPTIHHQLWQWLPSSTRIRSQSSNSRATLQSRVPASLLNSVGVVETWKRGKKKHAHVQTKTENLVSLENGNGMLH